MTAALKPEASSLEPEVTPYIDHGRGMWYVNVYWPATPTTPWERKRLSLGLPKDQDPTETLERWKAAQLPGVIRDREERLRMATAPEVKPRASAGPQLRDLMSWYLDTHLAVKGAKRETAGRYRPTMTDFVAHMSTRHVTRVAQLSTRLIEEWQLEQSRLKKRDKTSRSETLIIKRWLGTCAEAGECAPLPLIKWTIPKKVRGTQHKVKPKDSIDAWLAELSAFRPMVGLVARWAAASGWRIGDVLDLRIGEIDRPNKRIDRAQLKTDRDLPYPLTPRLEAILAEALAYHKSPQPSDNLFLNHKRRPWTYKALYNVLITFHNPDKYWTGPGITFRDLRKSFATHLAMGGCPPNVLKELLGHADIRMTLGYYVDVDLPGMRQWNERYSHYLDGSDPLVSVVSAGSELGSAIQISTKIDPTP